MANNLVDDDYERVLLVKPSVLVYHIPPLMSASRGFRAADWKLAEPNWTGRLRLISKANQLFVRIEDATTGSLYCQAPVPAFPGPQVQPVVDSRRYFVVKVVSDTGRTALIGLGFADGADSFDFTVALQDYFATIDRAVEKPEDKDKPRLDLSLKGDIRLNIGGIRSATSERPPRATQSGKTAAANIPFVLPPPPSSKRK